MDFSQIQLIYSAEGNANLVVALPQLKKVLRLPKSDISISNSNTMPTTTATTMTKRSGTSKCEDHHHHQSEEQLKHPATTTSNANNPNPNGVVTTPDMDQTLGGSLNVDVARAIATATDGAISNENSEDDAAAAVVHPEELVAFVSVMAIFIGKEYVNIPEIVNIASEADRRRINDFCRPFRPAHRLDKEFCGQFGLLLPDATLLPETLLVAGLQHQLTPGDTFAVDIKPKQGWMLQDIDVDVEVKVDGYSDGDGVGGCPGPVTGLGLPPTPFLNPFNLKASTRCRYCTMQFSKLRAHKISKVSAYCPIDMFSGKPEAMRKSLNALLECPQNNLRIFRNGNLIYGDQTNTISLEELKEKLFNGDLTTFQDLIINCLLRNYSGKPGGTGVLERILNIQLLAKDYMTHQSCSNFKSANSTKRKTFKWLKKFLEKKSIGSFDDLKSLEKYLIAATFLDCSIIVAFKEIHLSNSSQFSGHPNVVCLENGKSYLTKVSVLDMDPKPDNHFEKFVKNTNSAYECASGL
ncbi:inositol-pentakisphosphate 2-kinase isoform X2 [Eupeodes corollae]|uniref:inositol-pentakisphosphate 2-kinase isoform X2 n=1 Tax=Eupeodes corollae TaxID=290404 RepID=UPI002490582D|nr:inositol-pentakisphosphate 2-kinase isoform X2 [Eupeodes corollae]